MQATNLEKEFEKVTEHFSPRVVAELNGQYLKIAKAKGEMVWHDHANEDEMFYIVKGEMELHFRDRIVPLKEGDFIVVPKGVEHRPVAREECWVALFEPKETAHTGDVESGQTKSIEEQLQGS